MKRRIMISLLIAALLANNAMADSENTPICSMFSEYYTKKIYDRMIGYPSHKVTEINDGRIAVVGQSADYKSDDDFCQSYTSCAYSGHMIEVDECGNVVERIKISNNDKENEKERIGINILDCFEGDGMLYLAVYKSRLIECKYEDSYLMIGIKNRENVFTRMIDGKNVKNIFKVEKGFVFTCEEDGKIILKKINTQGEIDVIDYIGDTNSYKVIAVCESRTDYYALIDAFKQYMPEYVIKKISKNGVETETISVLDNRKNNTVYNFDGINYSEEGIYVYGSEERKNKKTKEMICRYDDDLALKWNMTFEMTYEGTHIAQIELMPDNRMICLVRERPTIIKEFKNVDSKIQILIIDDNKNISLIYDGYDECFAIKYYAENLYAFWYGNLGKNENIRYNIYMTKIPIETD